MALVETRVLSTADGKLVYDAFLLASAYIWKIQVNICAGFISGGPGGCPPGDLYLLPLEFATVFAPS